MRYQQAQNTQRIYDDIRVKKTVTTDSSQELLSPDLFNADEEDVFLFEIITSATCEIAFTFSNGKTSHKKTIEPERVVTFENLRPIVSIIFYGEVGTQLEFAIAV